MMHDMTQWAGQWGTMMWGVRLWGVLLLVPVVLGITALIQHVISGNRRE